LLAIHSNNNVIQSADLMLIQVVRFGGGCSSYLRTTSNQQLYQKVSKDLLWWDGEYCTKSNTLDTIAILPMHCRIRTCTYCSIVWFTRRLDNGIC